MVSSAVPAAATRTTSFKGTSPSSKYVKLNIGGALYYTTMQTLTKQDTMLKAMFSGRMEVLTDSEGKGLLPASLAPASLSSVKKSPKGMEKNIRGQRGTSDRGPRYFCVLLVLKLVADTTGKRCGTIDTYDLNSCLNDKRTVTSPEAPVRPGSHRLSVSCEILTLKLLSIWKMVGIVIKKL